MKRLFLLSVLLLAGCQPFNEKKVQYFSNHANDYLRSSLIAPLRIPSDLSVTHPAPEYPLPEHIPSPDTRHPVSIVPPGITV